MKKKLCALLVGALLTMPLSGCTININANNVDKDTAIVSDLEKDIATDEEAKFVADYSNTEIPDFKMLNSDGKLISLKELKGNYIVYFARTDCEWCDKALPQIQQLKDDGLRVVSIYRRNTVEEVKEHLTELEFTFDELTLCGMSDPDNNNVLDLFDLPSVPTTLAVKDGVIVGIHIGTETDSDTAIVEMVTSSFKENGGVAE